MPKKKKMKGDPQVHEELKGFKVEINEFGEIVSNFPPEKLNEFLNKNVSDKKFKERDDEDRIRKEGTFKKDKGKKKDQ